MKNRWRSRILVIVLLITFLLNAIITASAESIIDNDIFINRSLQNPGTNLPVSKSENELESSIEQDFNYYGLRIDQMFGTGKDKYDLKNEILSYCIQEESNLVGGRMLYEYSSNCLALFLPECKEIEEIYIYTGPLVITYQTTKGKRITLLYEEELVGIIVIDLFQKSAYQWINGCETKNSLEDVITYYDDSQQQTQTDYNDALMVNTRSNTAIAFDSIEAAKSNLEDEFPCFSMSIKATGARYCSALNHNVSTRAAISRPAYSIKSSVSNLFIVGTSVSSIAWWYGLSSSTVINMLSAAGIIIGIGDVIVNQIRLYKSFVFSYPYLEYGQAWDSIRYNGYISIYYSQSSGTMTYGYTSAGVPTWVNSMGPISSNPSDYYYLLDLAIYYYNSEVTEYLQNGYSYPWFPPNGSSEK